MSKISGMTLQYYYFSTYPGLAHNNLMHSMAAVDTLITVHILHQPKNLSSMVSKVDPKYHNLFIFWRNNLEWILKS